MRTRGLVCFIFALAAFPLLSLPARAASFPAPLPAHIAAHVSVKSPLEFLEAIDSYAVAATKDTENEIMPGLISMFALMWNPLLMNSFKLEDEAHVILPVSAIPEHIGDFSKDLDSMKPVFVFGLSDFFEFARNDAAWKVPLVRLHDKDAAGFAAAYQVHFSKGNDWALVDLGGGRAAFGSDAETIRRTLEGWTPKHDSRAVFSIHSSIKNAGGNLSDELLTLLTEKSDDFIAAVTGEGLTPEIAKGMLAAMENVLPELAEELGSMKDVVFDIAFDDDGARIDLMARPGGGTTLSEMAGQIAKAGALDAELSRRLPAGASAVFITAPFAAMLPDAKSHLEKLTSMVYGDTHDGALSGIGTKAMAAVNAFMDSNPGHTVAGSYVDIGKQYSLAFYEVGDTEKAMQSITGGFELFNDIFAVTMEDLAKDGIRLEGGMKTEGDASYHAYRFVFTKEDYTPSTFAALFDSIRFFTAPVKGGIVTASGQLTDEDFLDCLAKVGSGTEPGSSLLVSARAKEALPGLPYTQAMAGAFDAGYFIDMLAMQHAQVMTMLDSLKGEEDAANADALERIKAFLAERKDRNGEFIGFGMGADGGWLVARALVPAAAVNQIVRDSGEFGKLIRRRQTDAFQENLREQEEPEEELEDEYEEEEYGDELKDEGEDGTEEEPAAA